MKIKQTLKLFTAFLFLLSTAVSFVSFGPVTETAVAYKCVGTPDDYYFEDPGELGPNKTQIPAGANMDNYNFRWDPKMGRCVVDVATLDGSYKSQNDDGSPRACKSGERQIKHEGVWRCAPVVTRSTNDKPVNDDGSAIDASQRYCGEEDTYDEESFSCKENGFCGIDCDYNKVGLNDDPTTSCLTQGGKFERNGSASKCNFTDETCKQAGKKLAEDSSKCEELSACDKKYPNANQNAERTECEAARNDPNRDCEASSNESTKAACEAGRAAAPERFDGCGQAETVLVRCDREQGIQAIGNVLKIAIMVLTIIIGVAAVGGLAWASILYAKAEDNQSNVTEARTLIRNIVIGILLYGFMVAIVNWLVPGGVIG